MNNGLNIGKSSNRISMIYLSNQPNISSDSRYKTEVSDIPIKLIEVFGKEITPKMYRMKNRDENIHFGYIAQDVERALFKYCLSEFGLSEAKNKVKEFGLLSKSESYMSLLYGEIAVIMEAYNRLENKRLKDRLDKLEEQMKGLIK